MRTRLAYRARERGDADLAEALQDDLQRDTKGRFKVIEAQGALLLVLFIYGAPPEQAGADFYDSVP